MESLSAPLPGHAVRSPGVVLRLASDERLARWASAGREGAMAAIFERYHSALHRYCHSILGNSSDAADALQNTMVKALRSLPGETRQIALKPWLYRIAHNESISLLRARRPESDLDVAADVSDIAAAGVVESRELLRELTADLGELTERQRGALLMRELGGLEFEKVAQALGTSPTAVKQSVYEARRALQSMQEGRAMDCEAVRRTLSDGDGRRLRGMSMRGHLRSCGGCRDFEAALQRRPERLAALIPPLPVAAVAAMLHGLLGGGGAGTGTGGGGLLAGLAGSANATTVSLGAKAAATVAVGATLTGGAVYAVPELDRIGPERRVAPAQRATEAGARTASNARAARVTNARRSLSGAGSQVSSKSRGPAAGAIATSGGASGAPADNGRPGGRPANVPLGKPAGKPGGKPVGTPAGKPSTTPGARPSDTSAGRSSTTPGGKPAASSGGRSASAQGGRPATTPAAASVRKPAATAQGGKPGTRSRSEKPDAAGAGSAGPGSGGRASDAGASGP